jgi:hypothetical protein
MSIKCKWRQIKLRIQGLKPLLFLEAALRTTLKPGIEQHNPRHKRERFNI